MNAEMLGICGVLILKVLRPQPKDANTHFSIITKLTLFQFSLQGTRDRT